MPENLRIDLEWEDLRVGAPEERACFASLAIYARNLCFTEGLDRLANQIREAPRLSAYHLGEWLAWNWWRLRWEPRRSSIDQDWLMSHRMASIGGGYVWPDIEIVSDGQRIAINCKATQPGTPSSFHYTSSAAVIIPANVFENHVDEFLLKIRERLIERKIRDTNFAEIFRELENERKDPQTALYRRVEALLGFDPGEGNYNEIGQMLSMIAQYGEHAVEEMAGDAGYSGSAISLTRIEEQATSCGAESTPRDRVRLDEAVRQFDAQTTPAWQIGSSAALALRSMENLGGDPISDEKLAELAAVGVELIRQCSRNSDLPFALDREDGGVIALRSKWKTGRRFELARLIGDLAVSTVDESLHPATRSYTYWQKVQRAFAAELLAPAETVEYMTGNDFSAEKQEEIAEYFSVSPLAIRTILANRGKLDQDEREELFERMSA